MPALISTDVHAAADCLIRGELVAIPTETVYGLGANAIDERAAASIFTAKDRPAFDPLIIHQSSKERLFDYATDIPDYAHRLADRFWPGPLTLVLEKSGDIPDLVTAGLSTVAMRVPDHPIALELLRLVDFPVAAPSANPFGFVSPTTAGHVADQLGDKIPFILDGGPCRVGLESTIVGFQGGEPVVYRKGGLAIEDIEAQLGRRIEVQEHSSSKPQAPGMLSRHYSPGCKIELLTSHVITPSTQGWPEGYKLATVNFGKGEDWVEEGATRGLVRYDLSPQGDLDEAAANLFTILRKLNHQDIDEAWIYEVPETGIGRAINDRLRRAAARE